MAKKTNLILLLALSLTGCNKYEPLNFARTPYEGDELRTDGFWYHVNYSQYEGITDWMNLYFLYRDGTFFRSSTPNTTNPDEVSIDSINKYGCDKQIDWGVFIVEGSVLMWSKWYWQSLGSGHAYLTTFEIVNDTCFKREGEEEYFYFYPFDYKPDSTIARQWIP